MAYSHTLQLYYKDDYCLRLDNISLWN